jgi:hypothetical protein
MQSLSEEELKEQLLIEIGKTEGVSRGNEALEWFKEKGST